MGLAHATPVFWKSKIFFTNGSRFGTYRYSTNLDFYANNERIAIDIINGLNHGINISMTF